MDITLLVATLLLMLATLIPLSRHSHWFVRGFDFPRLQLTIFAALVLGLQGGFINWQEPLNFGLLIITTTCLIWHLWWIAPYTPIWPTEVKSAPKSDEPIGLSIITANVLMSNRDAEPLLALVKSYRPDILVTLESDAWWQSQLNDLESIMPYTVKCPLDNLYGMHVYSRLPLSDSEISFLVEKDVPSIHTLVSLENGEQVRMHFLHPAPPSPTENEHSTPRDAELVIVGRSVMKSQQPVIVTGDLNDVAWSPTTRLFRKISGLLDPRVGRGMFNTFHAQWPCFRWPLDHLFHSEHFTLHTLKRLPSIGSDHFALYSRLTLTPGKETGQQGLQAEKSDEVWAREITSDKQVDDSSVPKPGNNRNLK